jgi:hypothetical protein
LGKENEWKEKGAAGPGEYRADQLRGQIAEFLPTDVTAIGDSEFPAVLARCVGIAVDAAQTLNPDLRFTPVLLTSYKDGSRMFTATCTVSELGKSEEFPSRLLKRWKFSSSDWSKIQYISAPLLSSKEQYRLDENLHLGPAGMLSKLKFLPADSRPASLDALKSYKIFHRFYPTFRHVED